MEKLLIVCPLVFLAGCVDAIAGGGGLISLPAYFLAGFPAHQAIATNKLSSSVGTLATVIQFVRKKFIEPADLLFVPAALGGSFLGAQITLHIDAGFFPVLMLVIVPFSAFCVMKASFHKDGTGISRSWKTFLIIQAIAFGMGIYDGFYGPGTGTFLMLLLTWITKISILKANGLTKVINLSTNISALAVYLFSGNVQVLTGVLAALFSVGGNMLGASLAEKIPVSWIRKVILLVLAIFMVRLVWDLGGF